MTPGIGVTWKEAESELGVGPTVRFLHEVDVRSAF